MEIKDEKEYQDYVASKEILIAKGTKLGDMELLSEEDKRIYSRLAGAIHEYEAAYHPLPGKISTLHIKNKGIFRPSLW